MKIDLLALMKRAGVRRRRVRIRPIRVKPAQVQELNAIYQGVVDIWEAGVGRLVEEYERSVGPLTTDSPDDIERLLDLLILETTQAMVRISARLREWGGKAERWHRQQFAEGILAATSIELGTILSPFDVQETVEAVLDRNINLIRSVSDQTRSRIADIVFRNFTVRTAARTVAAEIREAVEMSRQRSLLIARDQNVKMASALDRARQEQVGVQHFVWRHSGKVHFRQEHLDRNGTLYRWRPSSPPPGLPPPSDLPGFLPYCGCVAQATLIDSSGERI